jgi:predicted nucleotidyltransferase component of viral defense system
MAIDTSQDGPWRELFEQAMELMKGLPATEPPQRWTFGGGTVLMLRHRHRMSKDIDLFVSDPKVLSYLSPRLSDAAEAITADYVEAAEYIKLLLPQGEIDVVACPNLTSNAYKKAEILGYTVLVETSAEIIAKKMYHRGNTAKGRDLFDFALVLDREPDALISASQYLLRHRDEFISQLDSREQALRAEFNAIDTLEYTPTFEDCIERVRIFLQRL